MLKFEDQDEVAEVEQIRVSPAELMGALRTVEERKEAEARALEETIPLGQAIQTLGLNHTPEEVLEALNANRARESRVVPQSSTRPLRLRTTGALSLGLLLLCIGVPGMMRHSFARQDLVATPAPAAAVNLVPTGSVTVGLKTKPLSQIAIGEEFHSDVPTLLRLARGTAGADTLVDVGAPQQDLWTAVRGPSGLELKGWTTPAEALELANGQQGILLRSSDSLSDQTAATVVQVPLNRLNNADYSPGSWENITIKAVADRSR